MEERVPLDHFLVRGCIGNPVAERACLIITRETGGINQ